MDFFKWKGDQEVGGDQKRVKMCYVHVVAPHKQCKHYVVQTYTVPMKFKKK